MHTSLLLCGLLLAQTAVEPPVVGRPTDWSGAIGGPFVVTLTAEPVELMAEDRLRLTVRIAAPDGGNAGNLRNLKRLALAKLDAFRVFAIENLDEYDTGNPPERHFRYWLRPRSAEVKEIPRLKFVYFNPRAGRYQTTYAEAVPLTVKPRAVPAVREIEEVARWMLETASVEEILGPPPDGIRPGLLGLVDRIMAQPSAEARSPFLITSLIAVAVLLPPFVCTIFYVGWRRARPNAARLARAQRSRAAATALHALNYAVDDLPGRVSAALLGYLHDRMGMNQAATAPAEVKECLTTLGVSPELRDEVVTVLRRCEEARFAREARATSDLAADAESFILQSETTS